MFAQTRSMSNSAPSAFSLCALATFAALPWPKVCCVITSKPRASESRSTQRAPTDTTTAKPPIRVRNRRCDVTALKLPPKSRGTKKKDFEKYDLILVMDSSNFHDVMALAGDREDWQRKVKMFLAGECAGPLLRGRRWIHARLRARERRRGRMDRSMARPSVNRAMARRNSTRHAIPSKQRQDVRNTD